MLTRDGLSQLWNEMVKDGELQERILPDHNLRLGQLTRSPSLGTSKVLHTLGMNAFTFYPLRYNFLKIIFFMSGGNNLFSRNKY